MTARFSDWRTSASSTGRLDVTVTLQNTGSEPWEPGKGDSVSYLVLDAITGNLVTEGGRTRLGSVIEPKASVSLTLSCELPSEPGAYRIYVSPLRESVAWFYQRGSPFLALDIEVGESGARLIRESVTTLAAEKLRRALRTAGRAFVYPLRTIMRHHSLIRSMVRRDIVGRYRGSYGGLTWTVIQPLLMMLTYYFVFGVVMQIRFGEDGRPSNFVLYFLAGMLPWMAFSEAVGRAPTTVYEHGNFVRKLLFPVETLPVNLVLAGLLSEAFGVAIFLVGLGVLGYALPATALYLPLILVPQFLFTLGVSWFMAALGVFFRDLGQINAFLMTVWFFTTPICYDKGALPQNWLWLFEKNPMYILVESYRAIFLEASAPAWAPLAALTAASAVVFVLGHAWFYKLKGSFADLV